MGLETEHSARVYDNDHGFYVSVGPDRDGLGLCEMLYRDGDKDAVERSFSVSWEHAEQFAKAILDVCAIRDEAK